MREEAIDGQQVLVCETEDDIHDALESGRLFTVSKKAEKEGLPERFGLDGIEGEDVGTLDDTYPAPAGEAE